MKEFAILSHCLYTGDASITTLWGISDGRANYTDPEPTQVLADTIHSIQPDAKIFAVLRNPLDRWVVIVQCKSDL